MIGAASKRHMNSTESKPRRQNQARQWETWSGPARWPGGASTATIHRRLSRGHFWAVTAGAAMAFARADEKARALLPRWPKAWVKPCVPLSLGLGPLMHTRTCQIWGRACCSCSLERSSNPTPLLTCGAGQPPAPAAAAPSPPPPPTAMLSLTAAGTALARRTMATWAHEVRETPCKVLTEAQREHYLEHGYLVLPGFVSGDTLARLKKVTDDVVERSAAYTRNSTRALGQEDPDDVLVDKLMLAEGHTASAPMVTRLSAPVEVSETYWSFASGLAADVAEDLLGPNVRFHHSKLNFKWPGSRERIHWHQDIQFWPHTNYTPLTIGLYLNDTTEEMGPMQVVPLSTHDELFPLVDDETGEFTGVLSESQLASLGRQGGGGGGGGGSSNDNGGGESGVFGAAVSTAGPAGTLTIHNARCVHSSSANTTDVPRPLLLQTFASTSAGMIIAGTNGVHRRSVKGTPVVRGVEEAMTVFDPRPLPMAPDFSAGYKSPFIKADANTDG